MTMHQSDTIERPEVALPNLPSGRMLIGGAWVAGASGETIAVEDPATGRVFAHVDAGGAEDVDRAVRVARAAFESPAWSRMRPLDRARLLETIARKIEEKRRRAGAARKLRQRQGG
ncbi:aldehyde dehydrogenase family protein [Novosphingobium colocasiae]